MNKNPMTEHEWLARTEPHEMLSIYEGQEGVKAIYRKLLLYGCACCRRIWRALIDERSRTAIEVVERYADDLATEEELMQAKWGAINALGHGEWVSGHHAARAVCEIISTRRQSDEYPNDGLRFYDIGIAADQAQIAVFYDMLRQRGVDIDHQKIPLEEIDWQEENTIRDKEARFQLCLIRDIFGNPFRPMLLTAYRTPTVVSLARTAYEDRELPAGTLRSDNLVALADALEQAGCDDVEILSHCRDKGPHVRGCCIVDLILEKS